MSYNQNNYTTLFDREASVAVKGFAVLMMVTLHVLAFPSRNGDLLDASFLGNRYTLACGVCVSIYVFVAGYANQLMYSKSKGLQMGSKVLRSIKKLYGKWLSIAFPLLLIVFLFKLTAIPHYGSTCQISNDISELLGGDVRHNRLICNILLIDTTYCGEWWFLALYIELLLISLLLPRNLQKRNCVMFWTLLFVISLISQYIYCEFGRLSIHLWSIAQYVSTFFLGMIFARFSLFDRMSFVISKVSWILLYTSLLLLFVMRAYSPFIAVNNNFFAPFMILILVVLMIRVKLLREILLFFGNISTEIWLCHSFFVYYGFYPIAYISANPWIVLAWIVVLSIITSFLLKYSYTLVFKVFLKTKAIYSLCISRLSR